MLTTEEKKIMIHYGKKCMHSSNKNAVFTFKVSILSKLLYNLNTYLAKDK